MFLLGSGSGLVAAAGVAVVDTVLSGSAVVVYWEVQTGGTFRVLGQDLGRMIGHGMAPSVSG